MHLPTLRLLSTCLVWAAGLSAAQTPGNLQLSEDGSQVVALREKLVWPRCVEGMQWNGKTCTGQALLVDHAGALALATAKQKADGLRWRLPRVPELRRLTNPKADPAGIDPLLFPAAPAMWYWSATSSVSGSAINQYNYGNIENGVNGANISRINVSNGWAVNLQTGEARGDVAKRSLLPVRLVRPQD